MKKLSLFLCSVAVFCLFNLNTVMAQDPPVTQNDPNQPTLTDPKETPSDEEEVQYEHFDQKAYQIFYMLYFLQRDIYWMTLNVSRNTN